MAENVEEAVKENIEKAQQKQKAHYDRKHGACAFYQVGALVKMKDLSEKRWLSGLPMEGSLHNSFLLYISGISSVQLSDGTLIILLFADNILPFRPARSALDIKVLQEDVNAFSMGLLEISSASKQMLVSMKINHTPIPAINVADKPLEIIIVNV